MLIVRSAEGPAGKRMQLCPSLSVPLSNHHVVYLLGSMAFVRQAQRPRRQSTCISISGFSDVASAVCANKPGSSRRQQGAITLRLRSAVRTCRQYAIGLFGGMSILAMHMRVARRFVIPELADHKQAIELWASTVPEWASRVANQSSASIRKVLALSSCISTSQLHIAACVVLDLPGMDRSK